MLALLLLLAVTTVVALAAPGRASDPPGERPVAVVEPGDTLWSFAERHVPGRSPLAAIDDIRELNRLEGYVIHPGQRLLLPGRR